MDKRIIVKKWKTKNRVGRPGYIYLMECLYCHKTFELTAGYYNLKRGKFCNHQCHYKFMKGKSTWNKNKKMPKGFSEKISLLVQGKNNPNWKGGRKKEQGYIYLYLPKHPYKDRKQCYPEHRYVCEFILKRFLKPFEIIHHIGTKYPMNSIENKSDNRPENLYLFSSSNKHLFYHKLVKNNKIKPITKSNLQFQSQLGSPISPLPEP